MLFDLLLPFGWRLRTAWTHILGGRRAASSHTRDAIATAHKVAEELGLKHESVGVGNNEHFVQRVTQDSNLTRILIACKDMRPPVAQEGNRRIGRQILINTNASDTHIFLLCRSKSFENGLCVFQAALENEEEGPKRSSILATLDFTTEMRPLTLHVAGGKKLHIDGRLLIARSAYFRDMLSSADWNWNDLWYQYGKFWSCEPRCRWWLSLHHLRFKLNNCIHNPSVHINTDQMALRGLPWPHCKWPPCCLQSGRLTLRYISISVRQQPNDCWRWIRLHPLILATL